jgi:carbon-monoxide dehydrogenase medium subunit
MKPSSFRYHAPKTIKEAVSLLAQFADEDGRILAGGQSLVPMMNLRLAAPKHLIDINGVEGLDRVREEGGELVIPACVRHADLEQPVTPGPLGQLLSAVAAHVAHTPIRMRGTFCGSIANADPASEWCVVAATLGAKIIAHSVRGAREIDASDFFAGIMTTSLEPDECLTEVRIPLLQDGTRFGFYEVSRRAGDFAMAMALCVWHLMDGKIVEPRIRVGGVEAAPRRIAETEAVLAGAMPSREVFQTAANAASESLVDILEDTRIDAGYRRELARVVVIRALERCAV